MPLSPSPETRRKFFTVSEANRALPLIRAIVDDIVQEYRTAMDLKGRLSAVGRVRKKRTRPAGQTPTCTPRSPRRARSELEAARGPAPRAGRRARGPGRRAQGARRPLRLPGPGRRPGGLPLLEARRARGPVLARGPRRLRRPPAGRRSPRRVGPLELIGRTGADFGPPRSSRRRAASAPRR